jgi:enoyl-CoA hydratase/carnithine racemase
MSGEIGSGQGIAAERRGAVLWVALNRPEALNAIDAATIDSLNRALDWAERSAGLRVLVLTGVGRAFSAGADLKALAGAKTPAEDAERTAAFLQSLGDLTDRIEALPLVTIGAANGTALAGGLELLLACDIVLVAAEAQIGDGHAKYGLLPGAGASVRLPRRIGEVRAKYLILSGALIGAAKAKEWGLAFDTAPAAELPQRAAALAAEFADKSVAAIARAKALLRAQAGLPHAAAMAAERDANRAHHASADRAEGLAAFAGKRKPNFAGD